MIITFKELGNYGRLGNQMFQFALLRAVALKLNCHVQIPTGNYDLLKFNIPYKENNFKAKFIDFNEKHFHFDPAVFRIIENANFYGYFQSYKYFDDIKPNLMNDFSLDNASMKKSKSYIDSFRKKYDKIVSMHVRRTDYLKYPNVHPVCNIEYYREAMDFFDDNVCFVIFSDDVTWCKQNFVGDNIYCCEENNNMLEMMMMRNCDHNIICNSSFSWWGAYLNFNKKNKVIYPKRWFEKDGPQDYYDLCPPKWISI